MKHSYLLLLLLATAAWGQRPTADSLTAAMGYNPRADMGWVPPVASAPLLATDGRLREFEARQNAALAAAHQRGDWRRELDAHRELFQLYSMDLGLAGPSLHHLHQAQAMAARFNDRLLQAWLLRDEGFYYTGQSKHEQAIEATTQALAVAPASRRNLRASLYSSVSFNYGALGDEPGAAHYERLALGSLVMVRPSNVLEDTCFQILFSLGNSNAFRKRWAKAEQYYKRAIAWGQPMGLYMRYVATSLAGTYTWENRPLLALRCLRPFIKEIMQDSTDANMTASRQVLASAYYENHQPDSARLHGRVALALAQRTHAHFFAYWASWALAGAAAEQHDYARAWHYQRLSAAIQDSMHVEEAGRRADFARHTTTVARQQARIALLTKDQELARLRQQRLAISLVLLAVLLAGGGGAAVYAGRQRQRRREAALRQRLAADLHDEVGSLLTRLSLESSLLSEGLRPPQEQQRQLSALVSVSQQALRQMRDVVWSIRPDHDTLPHVLNQMREHGYDLLTAAGLEFDFYAEENVAQADLPALARQHLYLIYKEALHNAVKHARGAHTLFVRLTLAGPALHLTVRDDGAGTPHPGRPSGLGLANMRQRAEAVGGTVAYDTAPGQGFTVEVRLPLAGQRLHPAAAPAAAAPIER